VLEFPFAPAGVPRQVTGRDALRAHMSHFPETFDVEFTDLVFHETVDPGLVIAEFRSTGTARPTGKPYEQTCISVVQTDDNAHHPLPGLLEPAGGDRGAHARQRQSHG
jgi:ketosteroid isomerase-like protein